MTLSLIEKGLVIPQTAQRINHVLNFFRQIGFFPMSLRRWA
jgi:hypothetical protein